MQGPGALSFMPGEEGPALRGVHHRHIPGKGFQRVRYYGWYSNRARGVRIIEPCFDDPVHDYDTGPVMAYTNDPDFAT